MAKRAGVPSRFMYDGPPGLSTSQKESKLLKTLRYFLPLIASAAWSQPVTPVEPALAEIAATRWFQQSAISPDGSHVAYVEALTAPGKSAIYISGTAPVRITAGEGKAACDEESIAWSPDSKQIAFLSDCAKADQFEAYIAPATGGPARQVTHLTGLLGNPHWSADGKHSALLFTQNLP